MYAAREGRITPDFLLQIKFDKTTAGSITELTIENLKFEISATGHIKGVGGDRQKF